MNNHRDSSSQHGQRSRFVLAGTNSGVGKTTFTLGLMAALQKRGLRVQGYKAGPDYIDPSYHTAVTGRVSRNLDTWMLTKDAVLEVYMRSSAEADVSVIEGVMGFYDGKDPRSNAGSTAELSTVLRAPTILIVNVGKMARSAAAIVKGFQCFDDSVQIAGVLVNHVGSVGHFQLVQTAITQECSIPVLGYLPKREDLRIPDRHLGLIPAIERGELQSLFDELANAVEETVNVDELLAIAAKAPDLPAREPVLFRMQEEMRTGIRYENERRVKIAIARDAAFNFYYPENLELLEYYGAELLYFSPLAGELVPYEADGLYLGGGFPEEFAKDLSEHSELIRQVRELVETGIPTFAECGGYMFLTDSITDLHGDTYPMVGLLPEKIVMQARLVALGYREIEALTDSVLLAAGEKARGHEFHYSSAQLTSDSADGLTAAYQVSDRFGQKLDGFVKDNLFASYMHFHFASNPLMAERFVSFCHQFREMKKSKLQ